MNKYLLSLLFVLSISIVQAGEIKHFADMPDKITYKDFTTTQIYDVSGDEE